MKAKLRRKNRKAGLREVVQARTWRIQAAQLRALLHEIRLQAGYPVGSGSVESGCKVVVQERMKQAGICWSRQGAQGMLALRYVLLSEQWDKVWLSLFKVPKLA